MWQHDATTPIALGGSQAQTIRKTAVRSQNPTPVSTNTTRTSRSYRPGNKEERRGTIQSLSRDRHRISGVVLQLRPDHVARGGLVRAGDHSCVLGERI